MRKFLCIRHNGVCRAGQWFLGEDIGEPLFTAELQRSENGVKIVQTGHIGMPFSSLADFIIEPGFRYDSQALVKSPSLAPEQREIDDFQHRHEETIEEELLARNKRANPTHTGRTE